MGTTLTNGIYLPNEGEKNCYAGLKINWETLDQKIADITALQQAVAGALHREIVESLPTTDIDPNTIYMILSGTSATENVYNEFMYVNNAWELIGTSATDLTNYYTKGDVDGLLVLKANASDLTSHTGDTTIHVTASDKTKWTNSANTHVLRLALSALTPSTSDNSFSNLDDSTALKVGDKVMDTAGVLFEVTAIDTANSTFTIGTALIDLAQDSDVVHKSGVETITGFKQFANIRATNSIKAINLDGTTTDLNNCYSDFAPYGETKGGNIQYYYCNIDAGTANISNLPEAKAFFLISITTRILSNSLYVKQILINSNSKTFVRYCNNSTWSSWVNETDSEYVHKSGNETISGEKTFNDLHIVSYGTQYKGARNAYILPEFSAGYSGLAITTLGFSQTLKIGNFVLDANNKPSLDASKGYIQILTGENNGVNACVIEPRNSTSSSLGASSNRWSKIYGTEYYYGSNNVEFSTKFVTTDTNQTISGKKTFSDDLTIYNYDSSQGTKNLTIGSSKIQVGDTSNSDAFGIRLNAGASYVAQILAVNDLAGTQNLQFSVRTKDSLNNFINSAIRLRVFANGNSSFEPGADDSISLGSGSLKYKDVRTNKVNGLEPSSLSLPATTGTIDISSYITDLTGVLVNGYTPSANGYIVITCNSNDVDYIKMSNNLNFVSVIDNTNNQFTSGILGVWQPCIAGIAVQIRIKSSALLSAKFIPCQGNV